MNTVSEVHVTDTHRPEYVSKTTVLDKTVLWKTKCHTPTSDKVTPRLGHQYVDQQDLCVHATSEKLK
jgi:hypothetical protein